MPLRARSRVATGAHRRLWAASAPTPGRVRTRHQPQAGATLGAPGTADLIVPETRASSLDDACTRPRTVLAVTLAERLRALDDRLLGTPRPMTLQTRRRTVVTSLVLTVLAVVVTIVAHQPLSLCAGIAGVTLVKGVQWSVDRRRARGPR